MQEAPAFPMPSGHVMERSQAANFLQIGGFPARGADHGQRGTHLEVLQHPGQGFVRKPKQFVQKYQVISARRAKRCIPKGRASIGLPKTTQLDMPSARRRTQSANQSFYPSARFSPSTRENIDGRRALGLRRADMQPLQREAVADVLQDVFRLSDEPDARIAPAAAFPVSPVQNEIRAVRNRFETQRPWAGKIRLQEQGDARNVGRPAGQGVKVLSLGGFSYGDDDFDGILEDRLLALFPEIPPVPVGEMKPAPALAGESWVMDDYSAQRSARLAQQRGNPRLFIRASFPPSRKQD
ncbi:MAG TPA: hypothetical protein VNK24_02845 [Elusimicrobiota bacterium]|nr:hypothetical protein [Elusimicrobiota bacterium]